MYQPHSGRATYSYYWPGSTHSYIILMEFVSMAVDEGDVSPLFSVGALGTAPEMSPAFFSSETKLPTYSVTYHSLA